MSYVVHLWRQPLPTSLAQAEALLRDLRQQVRFDPDPAADLLVQAIQTALPGHGRDEDWWTEAPEPDPHALALTLAPAVAELSTVLPAIESAARRLGWVLFDPQAGEVRLPSGPVLTRSGGRRDASVPADVVPAAGGMGNSPAARKAWLHQSLAPGFSRRGWRPAKGEFCFSKAYPWGEAKLYSNAIRSASLAHGLWLRVNYPQQLAPAVSSDGGPHLFVSLDGMAQRHGLALHVEAPAVMPGYAKALIGSPTYRLPFSDEDQAARCRDELAALYEGPVLDWLDTLGTVEHLEHWANRVPDAHCPFVGLRNRGDGRPLDNYHPDLLLAAAIAAPDLAQRASERLTLFSADPWGRASLQELLRICGVRV